MTNMNKCQSYAVFNQHGIRKSYCVAGRIIERFDQCEVGGRFLQRVKFRCIDGTIIYEYVQL